MKVNIDKFIQRINSSRTELAKELNVTPSNLVYWASGKNYPSPKVIEQLIRKGILLDELFGEELANIIQDNSNEEFSFSSDEFKQGVREALLEIINNKK